MDFSDLDSMFGDPSKEVKVLRELVEKLMELVITAMGEIETRFLGLEERIESISRSGPAVAPLAASPAAPVAPPVAPPAAPASISPPAAPATSGGLPPLPPAAPGGLPPPPPAAPGGGLQSDLSSALEKRQASSPGGMPPPPAPSGGGLQPPPAPSGGGFGGLQPPPPQPSSPPPAPSGALGLQASLKSELAEAFKKIRANLDEG